MIRVRYADHGPTGIKKYTCTDMRCPRVKRAAFLLVLIVLLASCASSNGMVRKCDGRRGTRVPMGVL